MPTCLPLIHPQTLPLFFALVGYLLWRRRPALAKHWAGVAAVALVLLVLNATYFGYAADAALHLRQHVQSGYGARIPPQRAALTPLRGGQLLWDDPLSAGIERLGSVAPVAQAAVTVARGIELLVWAGAAIVAWQALRSSRFFAAPGRPHPPAPPVAAGAEPDVATTRRLVLRVALAALLMQIVLYAAVGLPPWSSYYFGPLPTTLLFAWVALEVLDRVRLRGAAIALYGLCVAVATAAGIWQVHRFGWPRGSMSPNLGNQVEVARALNQVFRRHRADRRDDLPDLPARPVDAATARGAGRVCGPAHPQRQAGDPLPLGAGAVGRADRVGRRRRPRRRPAGRAGRDTLSETR